MNKQRGMKADFIRRATRILLIALGGLIALASANCARSNVADSAITAAVKSKLAISSGDEAINVNVDTRGGVVTLTGVVETRAHKEQAERIAASTEGVTRVINNLTVETRERDDAGEGVGMTANDLAILSKIKTRYVAEGLIGANVRVKDGVVTLNGSVEDARTRTRAESIARATSGVREVNNLLKIRQ